MGRVAERAAALARRNEERDESNAAAVAVASQRSDLVAIAEEILRKHAPRIEGLGDWRPDEVTVQRYASGSTGISSHRDGRRHAYLVAILTLEGSALLRQCSDRAGTTVGAWGAGAGSLVLLRGPGLGGIEDDRPLHAVDGPRGRRRTSLTLRATGSSLAA